MLTQFFGSSCRHAVLLGILLAGVGLWAPEAFEAGSLHISRWFNHGFGAEVLWSSSLLLLGCIALAISSDVLPVPSLTRMTIGLEYS